MLSGNVMFFYYLLPYDLSYINLWEDYLMKKEKLFSNKCITFTALTLTLIHAVFPFHLNSEPDIDAGISVCVIEHDGEEDEAPLDEPDFI